MVAVLVAVRPRTHLFIAVAKCDPTCEAEPGGRYRTPSGRSHNPPVVGLSPTPPTCSFKNRRKRLWTASWIDVGGAMYRAAMPDTPSGHIEQLPSGSWRAKVYAGRTR